MRLAFSTCQAKIFEEEIFVGTNFRDLAFDRENRENFCLPKMSRYMVVMFMVTYKLHPCCSIIEWGDEESVINLRTICGHAWIHMRFH